MAKTERIYLVGALICCLGSTALLVVSLATENWITAEPLLINSGSKVSHVNYGLFFGTLNKTDFFDSSNTFALTMTCLISDNVCAWSCRSSEVDRVEEVKDLYEGKNVSFKCDRTSDTRNSRSSLFYMQEKGEKAKGGPDNFINAGMWVSTIAFLAIALLFSVIGCGFTALNIFTNPIDLYASIFGLYIWYGIAAAADLLSLIIWGAEFGVQLSSNIAIFDTIVPNSLTSDGLASLGYSYFLIIPAEITHLIAIGLIFYRNHVINRESKQKTIAVNSQADNNDIIY